MTLVNFIIEKNVNNSVWELAVCEVHYMCCLHVRTSVYTHAYYVYYCLYYLIINEFIITVWLFTWDLPTQCVGTYIGNYGVN